MKYASSKGIGTALGSNGTLIDEAMARKMLDAGVKLVAISIAGVDAQTPDVRPGTLRAILRTADISVGDFVKLL